MSAAPKSPRKSKSMGDMDMKEDCQVTRDGQLLQLLEKSQLCETDIDSSDSAAIYSKVLVIYTGGTIGMKKNKDGVYSVKPNHMKTHLRSHPLFHDEAQLSNPHYRACMEGHHLKETLILPLSNQKRYVLYDILEYTPLLDSSNMTQNEWFKIAQDIHKYYKYYSGFVVLHGTDTMAYTASSLSFILESLGKTVILTGAQVPLFEQQSDGRDNFLGALYLAGHVVIPEVTVFFRSKLYRGNRCCKVDSGSFSAFDSPNMQPLVSIGTTIDINWDKLFTIQAANLESFHVGTNFNSNVSLLRIFPNITYSTVASFLHPPMEGVVLQTYGTGNAPDSRSELLELFKAATDRGIIIVNITQCNRGAVTPNYHSGKALTDAGIISGYDMTPEAALTKLSYVLGKTQDKSSRITLMESNLRGEMTLPVREGGNPAKPFDNELIKYIAKGMQLMTKNEYLRLKKVLFPALICAAASSTDTQSIEDLCAAGATVLEHDYEFRTPLHVAASDGCIEMVRYLLSKGAPVHAKDRWGDTPMDNAIHFRKLMVIDLLQEIGAHISCYPLQIAMDLQKAAMTNETRGFEAYYRAGYTEWNVKDTMGNTALHTAVLHNHHAIISFLIRNGADYHLVNGCCVSPWQLSKLTGNFEFLSNTIKLAGTLRESNSGNSVHAILEDMHNSNCREDPEENVQYGLPNCATHTNGCDNLDEAEECLSTV